MFSTRRRHPLQTFRFWFFITGAAAVTLAWRFDLLPIRIVGPATGSRGEESFTEVQLPDSAGWDEPVRRPFDDAVTSTDEPSPLPPQSEPFYQPEDMHASMTPTLEFNSQHEPDQPPVSDSQVIPASNSTGMGTARDEWTVKNAAKSPLTPPINFSETDRLIQSNNISDHIEAHRALSEIYWQQPASREQLRQRIDALAQRIYFQAQPHYMPAHELQPGDMLQTIAKQYDVSWQYLAKLNRVDPQRVRAGQRIKVIKGPFSAIIDLSDYEMTLHAHGYYVTRYPVGIGKDGSTPIGTFAVENKQVDPTYYGPDGIIDHDDETNPLGERWIDIGNSYGIHGTIDPGSIGRSESRGCVRMHNDDVAAVYDLLTIGSEVTIRE